MASVFAGIDVGDETVDVACRGGGFKAKVARNASSLQEMAAQLKKSGVERVVLEASGGYEQLVLEAVYAQGLPIVMVQPARARHFAKSVGQLAKTDPIDAEMLAWMAAVAVEKTPVWQPRTPALEELRALVQRREQLVSQRDAERKRLRSARNEFVAEDLRSSIRELGERIGRLEAQLNAVTAKSEELAPKVETLKSVKGVGTITAVTLLSQIPELGRLPRNKISALVGVAPITRESGKWKGYSYTWAGRAGPRKSLYMAALVAIRHNEHLSKFYKRLVEGGKHKKVALVAVMRKLLIHLNSLARDFVNPPTPAAKKSS